MNTSILISIIGALSAVTVSIIGAWLANRNSIVLQTRKLKENHYIFFIESLHNLASENSNKEFNKNYAFARDKLLLIASENVVGKLIQYENNAFGNYSDLHDNYLNELLKAIRIDLKLRDKKFPFVRFVKA